MFTGNYRCFPKKLGYKNATFTGIYHVSFYLQLLDDNTFIYNLRGLDLRTKSKGKDIDLELKIITGDKSDNITSIFNNKKTIKSIMNLINNKDMLQELFNSNEEIHKLYNRNKLLIDFNMIPNEIKMNICNLIDF